LNGLPLNGKVLCFGRCWGETIGIVIQRLGFVEEPLIEDRYVHQRGPIRREMRPKKGRELSWSSQTWKLCSNGIFPCQVDC